MTVHFNSATGKLMFPWEFVGVSGKNYITNRGKIVPRSALTPKFVKGVDPLHRKAGGTPTLDLDFTSNKSLAGTVSGKNLVTFSRASSGTYVGSDGLIKTTPVNLVTYSEQFDQWVIGSGSSVTANQAVAPNGTNTADRVQHGAGGSSWIRQQILTSGNTYTVSVYAKAVTPGTNNQFTFNVGSGTNTDPFITTSEWQRFSATLTATGSQFYINNGDDSFSTDVYFWGAQVQTDSTVTDYIPTGATISGAPRFDHDPATGESLGLLIEEARTNLALNSVTGRIQSAGSMTGPTSVYGPGGTDTAFQYLSTGGTVSSRIQFKSVVAANATQYTITLYVKGVNYNTVTFGFGAAGFGANSRRKFFLDTLTTQGIGNAAAVSIEDAGNGWRRIRVTSTATTSATGITAYLDLGGNGDGDDTHTTDQGFQIYGLQIEAGTFPTSYIPTTDSAVTRAADIATIEGNKFAKTNLLAYSERFEHSTWSKQTSVTLTPNSIATPVGTTTGTLYSISASSGRAIDQNFSGLTNGNTYVFSIYFKAIVDTTARIRTNDNSAIVNVPVLVSDGWKRIQLEFTKGSSMGSIGFYDVSGSSGNRFYVWGAQLEEGNELTEYTPSVDTFDSRASSATYVDDATGLIKTTPVNHSLHSEEINNWFKSRGVVSPNAAESPIGDQTADKWIPNTQNNFHFAKNNTSSSATTGSLSLVTYSIYAKQAGYRYLLLNTTAGSTSGNAGPLVDLQDGVVVDNYTATYSTTVTDAGNGWWRIAFTYTGNGTNLVVDHNPFPTSTIVSYTGNNTDGVLLWGAQLEEGTTATDYIPTGATISGAPRYENGELLLEEARTNLLLNSEAFQYRTQSGYGVKPTTNTNQTEAPDGTITAEEVVTISTSQQNRLLNSHNVTGFQKYTYSVFVKYINKNSLNFQIAGGKANAYLTFNFSSETITASGAQYISGSAGFEKFNNGWYRIYFSAIPYASGSTSSGFYSGTTADQKVYLWGEQLEIGTFPTSYIPTTGSSVTRAADVLTSALGVDSWYNQSEGAVFVKSSYFGLSANSTARIYDINDGTTSNRHHLIIRETNNDLRVQTRKNNVDGFSESFSIPSVNNLFSNALGYKLNDCASSLNGGNTVNDYTGLIPTVDRMFIGAKDLTTAYLNGHITRLAYFPTRLPDDKLESITA